jgi:hypothetical protein
MESDAQVMELAERYGHIVIPNQHEDLAWRTGRR